MSSGNPFQHEPRKDFTPQERARIFAMRGGICHRCTRKLYVSDFWVLEHLISLGNGGTNDDENMGVTCEWCIKEKNAEDAAALGKGRRAYTKHVVPSKLRRSKSWGRR